MRWFALFDDVGTPQRIADADTDSEAQAYLDAGFTEIAQALYDQLEATGIIIATLSTLALITTAQSLLTRLSSATRERVPSAPVSTQQLERLEANTRERLQIITRQYFEGDLNIDQWYEQSARTINANITAGRALGVGGFDSLTAQDRTAIEMMTDEELRFLNKFRREIDNGSVSEAQALARVQQYAGSAVVAGERGYQDAIGLPLLPAQPKVRTACHRNCKCRWRIVKLDGNGNWDCYWQLSPAEHCQTCLTRAERFNPLRIRNGVIQPFNPVGIWHR